MQVFGTINYILSVRNSTMCSGTRSFSIYGIEVASHPYNLQEQYNNTIIE
jgi:hypothetical protein